MKTSLSLFAVALSLGCAQHQDAASFENDAADVESAASDHIKTSVIQCVPDALGAVTFDACTTSTWSTSCDRNRLEFVVPTGQSRRIRFSAIERDAGGAFSINRFRYSLQKVDANGDTVGVTLVYQASPDASFGRDLVPGRYRITISNKRRYSSVELAYSFGCIPTPQDP